MRGNNRFCVILTTFSNSDEVDKVIKVLLREKLAACIQAVNIDSHYSWNNRLCHENEILLIIKTVWDKYGLINEVIKNLHSYETPEIIAINIEDGDEPYLKWIQEMTC